MTLAIGFKAMTLAIGYEAMTLAIGFEAGGQCPSMCTFGSKKLCQVKANFPCKEVFSIFPFVPIVHHFFSVLSLMMID